MKLFSNIVRLFGYVVAARFIYVAAINWHTTSTAINENRISRDIAVAGQTDSLLNQIFYNDILPGFVFGLLLLIPYGKLKRVYALPLVCVCLLLGMFSWVNAFRVYFLSERFVPEVVPHVVWISTAAFLAFLILFGIVALLNTKMVERTDAPNYQASGSK
jgi:hypothetical protein